jgi:hypothetical protein
MQRFTWLIAERDACVMTIIHRIEAGRMSPSDALDRCLGVRH